MFNKIEIMTYFITCDFHMLYCVKYVAFTFFDYPHDCFVNLLDNSFLYYY